MKIYSIWSNKDGDLTVVEGTKQPTFVNGELDTNADIKLYEINAVDYNSAMTKFYQLQGWEPYIPF